MHHAYLLLGAPQEAEREFGLRMEQASFALAGNPDYLALRTESFGIDEARLISERSSYKSFGPMKVFFISSLRYTSEAQNALLKTLEDPAHNTHFFIVGRTEGDFLPTLLSRMQVVRLKVSDEDTSMVEKFLSMNSAKRLLFAKKFADDGDDLGKFIDELMVYIKKKGKSAEYLRRIFSIRRYAGDRSGGTRIVLEHLALVL